MRILMLSNLCPPFSVGGYEIACANVAAGLHEMGHEVRLATTRSPLPGPSEPSYVERCFGLHWFQPVTIADESVRRYPLFHASISDYNNTAELLRLLRGFAPDVVYVWNLFGIGGIALLDLLNMLRVPWVMHLMDNMPHHLLAGAPAHVRSVFGGSTADLLSRGRVIAMSDKLVEEVLTESGIAFDGGVEIVPGWVDLRCVPEPSETRPGKVTRFVAAGQIVEHKGIGLILEATAILHGEGGRRFTVDVFGEGSIPFYIDLAQRLGVQDIIHFQGRRTQQELLSLYATYQAFLFPTWEREPFGFAPIEAAACGCVPILTRQSGAAERLVDTAHCLKIDRTAHSLADAMRQIIDGSTDIAAMSRRAMDAVRGDLSFEPILCRIASILMHDRHEWVRGNRDDDGLKLLLHTKHQLAAAMMFGQ
jgi:glycogen(starch) synthase